MFAKNYALAASAAALMAGSLLLSPAGAQAEDVVEAGNAVVTGFSGTSVVDAGGKKVHPLDLTFIDPKGTALSVVDVGAIGPGDGEARPADIKHSYQAEDIGQVFGVVLSDPDEGEAPDIYAAATSFYGLPIVGERDGEVIRLVNGEPGAEWMPGLFGESSGGGPGTIWKIDGKTGEVSLFANVMSGANKNAGPGLGSLAYDFVTRRLYVPNLETGLIHAYDESGQEQAQFDHGTRGRKSGGLIQQAYDPLKRVSIEDPSFHVEKPETWGFAEDKRLVVALAVANDRLYYSVASGPQIWSVGLDSEGGFLDDARFEFAPKDVAKGAWITAITFDGPNTLYLSQRGQMTGAYDFQTFAAPDEASVLKYTFNDEEKVWSSGSEEFAVGMTEPHRASNGGLALGYGYNGEGQINKSACSATLWTTGSHDSGEGSGVSANLQAMATSLGQTRTSNGPSSGSSALQGRVEISGLTELSPPSAAHILKLGSEGAGNGYLGALALYQPSCDGEPGEASERPDPIGPDITLPEDPDPPWPNLYPGLDIAKACAPAAFGGVIECQITATNTGTLPFIHPITISDASTILEGPGAGGAIAITSVTPDGPEWTCTPTPTMNLTCGLPPEHLLPGVSRSFTVAVDTSGMIAAGNVGFRNCASFGAPYWGIACDEAGADITVTKTAEPGCTAGNPCTFNLAFSNKSSTDFSGQVQLTDEMFLGAVGGALNAPVAIVGDLGCAGGNPASLPFTCQANLTLAAGETRTFPMTATMPNGPGNDYWARNCIAVTSPGLIPGDLATTMPPGGGSLGAGGAVSCTWMQVGNPTDHANLKMAKTPEVCGKLPGDENTVSCDFTISISNTGPSPFPAAVITFDETVDPAATLTVTDPDWTCAGAAPTYNCSSNNPVTLANNETVEIKANVQTPKAVVEVNTCRVPNTVTLTSPPVNVATNYLGTDDTATAEGDAFLLEFDGGGAAIILCDPTNLKTTKTAKGPCEKVDDGWKCDYEVTLLNTGPDPYKGKIELVDASDVAPISVSISGTDGWSRSPGIGHDLYQLPERTIEKGESVTLNLSMTVPDGSYCSVTNTAHMIFPVLDRHNKDKTDDTGVATARIPRPDCKRTEQCKPQAGELKSVSGACACEPGFVRGRDGQCVGEKEPPPPPPETKLCPDGYPVPRTGVCPCRDGETWNEKRNRCEKDDVVLPPPPPPPLCKLLPGQIRTRDNRCICENGRKWNSKTYCEPSRPSCKPRIGEVIIRGKCVCANGRRWNSETFCDPPPPPPVCPLSGTYQAAPGVCCKIGEVFSRGKCRARCEKPRFLNRFGVCTCGHGRVYDPRQNTCNKADPDPGFVCQGGDAKKAGRGWVCLCPRGQKAEKIGKDRFRCVGKPDPIKECKDKGGKWFHGRCIFDDPAAECRKKGWRWVRGTCLPPRDPAEECKKKGWLWIGKKCIPLPNPKELCLKKGWTWTGRSCVKPNDPKKDCKAKGWRWKRGKCLPPKNSDLPRQTGPQKIVPKIQWPPKTNLGRYRLKQKK